MKPTGNQSETTRKVLPAAVLSLREASCSASSTKLVALSLSHPQARPRRPGTHWGHRSQYRSCCHERCARPAQPELHSGSPVESASGGEAGVAGQSRGQPGTPPHPGLWANLVLGAAAALQAGEDLGLHALYPQFPLLCRRGLEVPRLPGEGHHHKLERLLGLCGHRDTRRREGRGPLPARTCRDTPPQPRGPLSPGHLAGSRGAERRVEPPDLHPSHLRSPGEKGGEARFWHPWHCWEWVWKAEGCFLGKAELSIWRM